MTENNKIAYGEMSLRNNGPSNLSSAEVIVPKLVEWINPESVIDIGCATGVWLNQFKKRGIRVRGVDGDWVKGQKRYIDDAEITYYDFESNEEFPIKEKYDLAVSLEMAEHLSAEKAEKLIDILTNLSDVVYFSAATPNSGGMHHVNERWPSYWKKKFEKRNYILVDKVRTEIWNNKKVCYFYAQESFLYVSAEKLENYPELLSAANQPQPMLNVVHPELFLEQVVKPSHEWKYLISMLRRVVHSMWMKWRRGL